MKTSKHLFILMLALGLLGACSVEPEAGLGGPACEGAPIPGAEIRLERTTGAPNTAEMQLPGLTSVCLKVETNAASGSVMLDDVEVVTPSDLKNTQQTLIRTFDNLSEEPHRLTLEVRGKPDDHYISVQAYYGTPPTPSAEISTNDEALAIAQGYMNFWSAVPSSSHWEGGTAASAIPLFSRDGVLEAFEVRLETESGTPAGFVILEANKHRPLLGTEWMHGEPLSAGLIEKFEAQHGPIPADAIYRFLWGGFGVVGLEITFADGTILTEKICEDFECPGVTFESSDLGVVDFSAHGMTPAEWEEYRKSQIQKFMGLLSMSQIRGNGGPSSYAGTRGFFDVPENPRNTQADELFSPVTPLALEPGECAGTEGPYESLIPGGLEALGDFYQKEAYWPEFGIENPEQRPWCWYGCAPTAAAMLLRYWDRRYRYVFPGEIDSMNSSGVDDVLGELRLALETHCTVEKAGSTSTYKMRDNLLSYINALAAEEPEIGLVDAGWKTTLEQCGGSEFAQKRKDIIWQQVDAGHPPIMNYVHAPPDVCLEDPDPTHSVPVYGYADDGDGTPRGDKIWVHRGWESRDHFVVDVDIPGNLSVLSLQPPCSQSLPDEMGLCMRFDDVPQEHWGRQSAETLSCMCVMRGHGDGTFLPDNLVTHSEFLKSLLRLAFPEETATLDGCRKDVSELGVPQNHWSSAYIKFAQDKGLMSDLILTDEGFFPTDEPIDRKTAAWLLAEVGNSVSNDAEFAVFKDMAEDADCFDENPAEDPPYTDNPSPASEYYPSIMATTSQCVFEGVKVQPDNPNSARQFLGDDFITRIEAAKTLCTARFGHESQACSTQHDCIDLTCG